MVERFGRIEEARGSIPLTSTRSVRAPVGRRRSLRLGALAAGLALLASLLATSCGGGTVEASSEFEGIAAADPVRLPSMELIDTSGEPFHLVDDTDGDVRLIYFGFTNCIDICNIDMAQLSQVMDRSEVPTNVSVMFVTVDPTRDSPEVLRRYLDQFDTSFIGLRAHDDDQLRELQDAVGALNHILTDTEGKPLELVPGPGHAQDSHDDDAHADDDHSHDDDHGDHLDDGFGALVEGSRNYLVGHDGRVFAFAPDGYGYTQYPHGTRQTAFVHDLPLLARET